MSLVRKLIPRPMPDLVSGTARLLAALLFALMLGQGPAQSEVIKRFESKIQLLPSGVAKVREDFEIDFMKMHQRHQIYRYIPTIYKLGDSIHKTGVHVTRVSFDDETPGKAGGASTWFNFADVEDVENLSSVWNPGPDLQIRIGGSEKRLGGVHKITIEYEVNRAVNFLGGKPELFLNVTGERWPYRIEHAHAVISFPRGTDVKRLQPAVLIGGGGHYKEKRAHVRDNTIEMEAHNIPANQGMFAKIELPKGTVVLPSVLQDIVWNLTVSYQLFVLPLGTTVLLTLLWWLFGRDPTGASGEESWKPPEYLSPAEVGTLIDERCDLTDIVSTVLDLAVRGFIKIRVIPYTGFIYLSSRDYEFTLLKSHKDKELKPHEQLLLVAMFGMSTTTYVSALKGHFSEYIPMVRRRVYSVLVRDGIFARDPENDRKTFISVGASVITVGVGLLISSAWHMAGKSAAVGIIVSGLILIFANRIMPKRSGSGTKALNQTIRFRDTVAAGGNEQLENDRKEDAGLFSRYLPYAIILGVADRWARMFKDVQTEYPEWFQVHEQLLPDEFSSTAFVTELCEALMVINRALTDEEPLTSGYTNLDDLVKGQLK